MKTTIFAKFLNCSWSFTKMAAAWQSPTHDVKDESSALHPPEINPEEHESIDDGSQDEGNRDRKSDSLW